jgi:hypothetical protein
MPNSKCQIRLSGREGGEVNDHRQWLLPASLKVISPRSTLSIDYPNEKTIASATYHPFKISARQVRHNQGQGSRS